MKSEQTHFGASRWNASKQVTSPCADATKDNKIIFSLLPVSYNKKKSLKILIQQLSRNKKYIGKNGMNCSSLNQDFSLYPPQAQFCPQIVLVLWNSISKMIFPQRRKNVFPESQRRPVQWNATVLREKNILIPANKWSAMHLDQITHNCAIAPESANGWFGNEKKN